MSISRENLVALCAFADIAEEYCALIESLGGGRPSGLYQTLESLLAKLHLAILPVEKEWGHKQRRKWKELQATHDQISKVAKAISAVVGRESTELALWHESLQQDEQPIDDYCATRAGLLWDDLADIYSDLHNGLVLWKLGPSDAKAEAAWEWRFNYECHWGNHLSRAMKSIHEARYHLYVE